MDDDKADAARRAVLDTVDTAEKRFRAVVVFGGAVEVALLSTYFAVMDFGDRLHWLILIAAVLVYGVIAAGLVALVVRNDNNTLRILKALDIDKPES